MYSKTKKFGYYDNWNYLSFFNYGENSRKIHDSYALESAVCVTVVVFLDQISQLTSYWNEW